MEARRNNSKIFSTEDFKKLIELRKEHRNNWKKISYILNSQTGKMFTKLQCMSKIYYEDNKDKVLKYQERYRKNNKDRIAKHSKKHHQDEQQLTVLLKKQETINKCPQLLEIAQTNNTISHVQQLEKSRQNESSDVLQDFMFDFSDLF